MIKSRNSGGNMLGVVLLTLGLIVALTMSGLTFNTLMFQVGRAQEEVDTLALDLCSHINKGDRVGQINELEQCSRELIYLSHKELKQCSDSDFYFLTPLCLQLLGEARAGHFLLERERKNQINLISREIQEVALSYNSGDGKWLTLTMPWLETCEPKITRVDVGSIDTVESNVLNLETIRELADWDRQHRYIDQSTNLYRGNINALIPGPGSDLQFEISALPAYVKGTCSPARNTNPDVFLRAGTVFRSNAVPLDSINQIPNAVQVFYSLKVAAGPRKEIATRVNLVSTGATNGAIAGSKYDGGAKTF